MLTDIYSKLYYKSYCYGSRFKISICVIDLVKESISFFLFKNITFLQPDTLLNRPAFRLMGLISHVLSCVVDFVIFIQFLAILPKMSRN